MAQPGMEVVQYNNTTFLCGLRSLTPPPPRQALPPPSELFFPSFFSVSPSHSRTSSSSSSSPSHSTITERKRKAFINPSEYVERNRKPNMVQVIQTTICIPAGKDKGQITEQTRRVVKPRTQATATNLDPSKRSRISRRPKKTKRTRDSSRHSFLLLKREIKRRKRAATFPEEKTLSVFTGVKKSRTRSSPRVVTSH